MRTGKWVVHMLGVLICLLVLKKGRVLESWFSLIVLRMRGGNFEVGLIRNFEEART